MADEKMNTVVKKAVRALRKPKDLLTEECLFFRF